MTTFKQRAKPKDTEVATIRRWESDGDLVIEEVLSKYLFEPVTKRVIGHHRPSLSDRYVYLDLECGHEAKKLANAKPVPKRAKCPVCHGRAKIRYLLIRVASHGDILVSEHPTKAAAENAAAKL